MPGRHREKIGELVREIRALRKDVSALRRRVEILEVAAATAPPTTPGGPAHEGRPSPPPGPEIDEETLVVLSAAVAAFLGKRAPIRQIRLLDSSRWAQQGRVTIQASHALKPR